MKIEATKRLATQKVNAATDLKGAMKFLKDEFTAAGLQPKKVYQTDPDAIAVELRAPNGIVTVGVVLIRGGSSVQFELVDATGVTPEVPEFESMDLSLELKKGKGTAQSLNKTIRGMEKSATEAEAYAQMVGNCSEWMIDFQNAVREIEQKMDKKKRA